MTKLEDNLREDALQRHPPVRVLYFDHTAQLGGGEIALADAIRNLDASRVTPIVVLAEDGPLAARLRPYAETHIVPLSPEIAKARKDALGASAGKRIRTAIEMLRYIDRLRRFLRENEIDIIHTNSLKADILGGIAGRLARKRVVWHVRDRIEDDYLPRRVVQLFRRMARIIPHFIIGNSAATLRTLHLHGRPPSCPVASGVDLVSIDRAELAAAHDIPRSADAVVGLVGRICAWKGQNIFLEAAAEVYPRFPGVRFQIIGAALFNEKDYEQKMRELPAALGIADSVDFLGFRSDVLALIKQLDILVHASTTGEPFGQVIVQGMAASKPVVATNGGGVPEIVVDGQTGILVPMGDTHAMADAIAALLQNRERAAEMGRQGRTRVSEHFTIEQTVRKLEAIYRLVMGSKEQVCESSFATRPSPV